MMLVFLTNQLGYNLSFPLSPLPTTFRLICGLEKSLRLSGRRPLFSVVGWASRATGTHNHQGNRVIGPSSVTQAVTGNLIEVGSGLVRNAGSITVQSHRGL